MKYLTALILLFITTVVSAQVTHDIHTRFVGSEETYLWIQLVSDSYDIKDITVWYKETGSDQWKYKGEQVLSDAFWDPEFKIAADPDSPIYIGLTFVVPPGELALSWGWWVE